MVTIMSDYKKVKLRSKIKTITAKKKIWPSYLYVYQGLAGSRFRPWGKPFIRGFRKEKKTEKRKILNLQTVHGR